MDEHLIQQIESARAAVIKNKEVVSAAADTVSPKPVHKENAQNKREQALKAFALREENREHKMPFHEIGQILGVSADKARSLVFLGKEIAAGENEFKELSPRISNILRTNCFNTRHEVLHALRTGLIVLKDGKVHNLSGIDEADFLEICEWGGLMEELHLTKKQAVVEVPKVENPANFYTYQISWSPELEMNAAICLEFPALFYSDYSPNKALDGIRRLVRDSATAITKAGGDLPAPRPAVVPSKFKD